MKRLLLPLLLLPLLAASVIADEGMWRPKQLTDLSAALKSGGLAIEPTRLSDLMGYPMNAVVSLGGCTASFVSAEGLVITNHHCAQGTIQHNSTPERNLLQDGFLAKQRSEELPAAPGSRVSVTVKVDDVTARIQMELSPSMPGQARFQAIEKAEKAVVAECEKDPGHRCRVASYNGGLEYELIKQLEIRDVRLVHAPAGSIGNFGGEVDNWMWPRHTGDYSFYRAYVGADGKPADFAATNVPYRPRHFLKVASDGLKEGSFVMVAGYPGNTNRYRTSREVESTFGWTYPTTTHVLKDRLDLIEKMTAGKPALAIKYASTVQGYGNTMKNNAGMLNGFARGNLVERKRGLEKDLQAWIEADPELRGRYLTAIGDLEALVERNIATRERGFHYDQSVRRSAVFSTARTLLRLSVENEKPDAERKSGYQERDVARIRERLTRMERTYDPEIDRALLRRAIVDYAAIPVAQHVAPFDEYFGIAGQRVDEAVLDKRLDDLYARTKLGDTAMRLAWIGRPRADFDKDEDPVIQLAVKLFASDRQLEDEGEELAGKLAAVRPIYQEALIAYLRGKGRAVYPDANGTLRVTYGAVKGAQSRDAVIWAPFTTLEGILEKDTGVDPFDSPKVELAAIRKGEFGRYFVREIGSVPVNFLSTVDTTGGNSGSPTLNAKGELVGLLFDGVWESVISGWDFLPQITRSIHVDIRYVLWVMDTLDGADHLMREMGVPPTEIGVGS